MKLPTTSTSTGNNQPPPPRLDGAGGVGLGDGEGGGTTGSAVAGRGRRATAVAAPGAARSLAGDPIVVSLVIGRSFALVPRVEAVRHRARTRRACLGENSLIQEWR
jgi:hypothetical protein